MKYLCIDTETNGLFDFSRPADAEGQPRLAHLCMIYADESLNVERRYDKLIKPDGWVMSEEIGAINGLTTERLEAEGVPLAEVLDEYAAAILAGHVVVAHNAQYDTKVMRGELRRMGRDDLFERTGNICTMRASVGVCRIKKASGNGFKFPKLHEAMAHFKLPVESAHNATNDAEACFTLFRRMRELGIRMEPAVHYAKTRPEREPKFEAIP